MVKLKGGLLVVLLLPALQAAPPVDVKTFTPADVKPMFDSIARYGEATLAEKNQHKRGEKWKQFIVVLLVSEAELRDRDAWSLERVRHLADEPDENKQRLAFLLNTRDHDIPEYKEVVDFRNNPIQVHGEVMFIRQRKDLMLNNFHTEFQDVAPIVVLYSHYIPCALIPKTPYSCSEELAKAFPSDGEYSLLVAFKFYYERTNVQQSLTFMKNGNILALQLLVNGDYVAFLPPGSVDDVQSNFQAELYQCLLHHPFSYCCTGETEDNRQKVVAYFVNFITYKCVAGRNKPRFTDNAPGGGMPDDNKNKLGNCLAARIDEAIGDDCVPCSEKSAHVLAATKASLEGCVRRSLQAVQYIGQPSRPNAIYQGVWNQFSGDWRQIYRQDPFTMRRSLPPVFCGKRELTLESLCSKVPPPPDSTSGVKVQPAARKPAARKRERPGPDKSRVGKIRKTK